MKIWRSDIYTDHRPGIEFALQLALIPVQRLGRGQAEDADRYRQHPAPGAAQLTVQQHEWRDKAPILQRGLAQPGQHIGRNHRKARRLQRLAQMPQPIVEFVIAKPDRIIAERIECGLRTDLVGYPVQRSAALKRSGCHNAAIAPVLLGRIERVICPRHPIIAAFTPSVSSYSDAESDTAAGNFGQSAGRNLGAKAVGKRQRTLLVRSGQEDCELLPSKAPESIRSPQTGLNRRS